MVVGLPCGWSLGPGRWDYPNSTWHCLGESQLCLGLRGTVPTLFGSTWVYANSIWDFLGAPPSQRGMAPSLGLGLGPLVMTPCLVWDSVPVGTT